MIVKKKSIIKKTIKMIEKKSNRLRVRGNREIIKKKRIKN